MLEYRSVNVLADSFFLYFPTLPGLRCWIQNKEHAASNLCRCRCTRNRTPSTTLAKWPGTPKPCHIPFVEKNSSISFNGDHDSSKADFPQILESLSHPTGWYHVYSIHLEHINVSPIDITALLAPKPSDAVALQAISQCGDLPRAVPCCTPSGWSHRNRRKFLANRPQTSHHLKQIEYRYVKKLPPTA